VLKSDLDNVNKSLLVTLAADKNAWSSGLIHDLAGTFILKRVIWDSGIVTVNASQVRVILFDSFVKPAAPAAFPLTCVVLNNNDHLLVWDQVAPWSLGFVRAHIIAYEEWQVIVEITSLVNYARRQGTYRYGISLDAITRLDGAAGDAPSVLSEMERDPPEFARDPEEMNRILSILRSKR
jgi:hypothetical protein